LLHTIVIVTHRKELTHQLWFNSDTLNHLGETGIEQNHWSILKMTIQVNLVLSSPNSPELSSLNSTVVTKIFALYLLSHPFLGCHLGLHIFLHIGLFGVEKLELDITYFYIKAPYLWLALEICFFLCYRSR